MQHAQLHWPWRYPGHHHKLGLPTLWEYLGREWPGFVFRCRAGKRCGERYSHVIYRCTHPGCCAIGVVCGSNRPYWTAR
jgi:hypothetical protein